MREFGTPQHNDFGTRKLAHYNEWLLNPARKVEDGPYPGFPEEIALEAGRVKLKAEFAERAATKAATKPVGAPKVKKAKKKPAGAGPTKADRAVEIYRELGGDKANVIAAFQERLEMSLAGATTYFYNSKKNG